VVAVKAGKAKKKLVLEPHDIIKELRLLSSLSHPAVGLRILSHLASCLHAAQIICVLGRDYDASQSLQRFWMPFMPFTLADLLSVPTFSPIPDPDTPAHEAQSALAFRVVVKGIIHQILSGVAYLHAPERRIAHRDIKPRNILLDTSCVAVLIDFGVAHSPAPGPRDVWPELEGKMYFEVGSGYVGCIHLEMHKRLIRTPSLLALTVHRSFYSAHAATMRRLVICGPSVRHLQNSSRPFTATLWPVTSTRTRMRRRGATLPRPIFLTSCLWRGHVPSGNATRCSMARAATLALRGAFFAPVARPHRKPGLSVLPPPPSRRGSHHFFN